MNGIDEKYLEPAMTALTKTIERKHPNKSYEITKPINIGNGKYKIETCKL